MDAASLVRALRDEGIGARDAISTIGTGMLVEPVRGLYGAARGSGAGLAELMRSGSLGSARDTFVNEAVDAMDEFQAPGESPQTEEGARDLAAIGQGLHAVGEKVSPYTRPITEPLGRFAESNPALAAGGLAAAAVLPWERVGGAALRAGTKAAEVAGKAARPLARDIALAASLRREAPELSGITRRTDLAPASAPRRSKAETEAGGYNHPIAGYVTDRPFQEMTSQHADIPGALEDLPPPVSLEDLQGKVLVPGLGDRSRAGSWLTHVNEQALADPVLMEGGRDFARMFGPKTGTAWASDQGAATNIANALRRAGQGGDREVVLAYAPMGHDSMDHNTMMSAALLDQIRQANITKKAMREFDAAVRAERPDFPGLAHPELADVLRHGSGELRKNFVRAAQAEPARKAGFPDTASLRKALTDPELYDTPVYGDVGSRLSLMTDPGRTIRDPAVAHSTYNTQLPGKALGGLDTPLSFEQLFPDFIENRRAIGKGAEGDKRAFQMSLPAQAVDQRMLDRVMPLVEQLRRAKLEEAAP